MSITTKSITTPELSSPASGPVKWLARSVSTTSTVVVKAQTWFIARHRAAVKLGVPVEDLIVELDVTDE